MSRESLRLLSLDEAARKGVEDMGDRSLSHSPDKLEHALVQRQNRTRKAVFRSEEQLTQIGARARNPTTIPCLHGGSFPRARCGAVAWSLASNGWSRRSINTTDRHRKC